jgi:hypothetical protein
MLTRPTTSGGLSPILPEVSLRAQYLIPVAFSLGCGIVLALAAILILVPSLFTMLEDIKRKWVPGG